MTDTIVSMLIVYQDWCLRMDSVIEILSAMYRSILLSDRAIIDREMMKNRDSQQQTHLLFHTCIKFKTLFQN
jgi:hypothetical protein